MKRVLSMGLPGMALAFCGGLIVLPMAAFMVATAAGPLFVGGIGLALIWLAGKSSTPVRPYRTRLMPRPRNAIRPFARTSHG